MHSHTPTATATGAAVRTHARMPEQPKHILVLGFFFDAVFELELDVFRPCLRFEHFECFGDDFQGIEDVVTEMELPRVQFVVV